MIKLTDGSVWVPDYIADDVLDIDIDELLRKGITHVVFDIDNTLVMNHTAAISDEYLKFIKIMEKSGLIIFLGTNTRRDISSYTKALKAKAISPKGLSYKPTPSFYKRIASEAGVLPIHIVMVGDRILNDICGGNSAGFTTILINPKHKKQTFIYRRYIRHLLKGLLR